MRPYLENTHHKNGEVAQGEGPGFKPQYCKKKKSGKVPLLVSCNLTIMQLHSLFKKQLIAEHRHLMPVILTT
jgi:hypothetical protein